MKLIYQDDCSKKGKDKDGKTILKHAGMKAAAVAAIFLSVMPLADKTVYAQSVGATASGQASAGSGQVTAASLRQNNIDLFINLGGMSTMERDAGVRAEAKKHLDKLEKQLKAKKIDVEKFNADAAAAQLFVNGQMPPQPPGPMPEPAPMVPIGPTPGVIAAAEGQGIGSGAPVFGEVSGEASNTVSVASPETKIGPIEAPLVDAGANVAAKPSKSIFSHNLLFSIEDKKDTEYTDPALAPFSDQVDIGGNRRTISLNNSFDLGAKLNVNEAGSAFAPTFAYRDLARLEPGVMWFGEQGAPFVRFMIRPELNVWRVKTALYSSVAFVNNMPSWFYHSDSVGLGYSQPMGNNFKLRLGGVIGGALSYPAWDDIYLNFTTGISGEIAKTVLLYAMPTFYFAAETPMKTAYAGYYRVKIQDIEAGIQLTIKQWTGRIYGDFGILGKHYGIYDRYGGRLTRTVNISKEADIDVWTSLGVTRWAPDLGGRLDPALMVGANIVIGGRYFNSTNTLNYSHLQDGGVRFARTDFPADDELAPYRFGMSGNPTYDVPINETKERIVNSASFAEFKSSYRDLSPDEVVLRARFIGAFMQQVAYANDAYDSLSTGSVLDDEIQRVASADEERMFSYLKRYVQWYETHTSKDPLPEDLKNGIAVCAGIHWLMAEFMRANGVDAIAMSVNTRNGPHVITAAQLKDKTVLLDYGKMYETPAGTLDQTLRFYGQNRQAPTFQSQMFGSKGYMGTYITSEGRLLHETIGIVNTDILKMDFLGVR